MNSAAARHLFLSRTILFASCRNLICAVFAATKGEQVGESLNAIYKLRLDVSALGNKSFSASVVGRASTLATRFIP
jgi:hypothetical protein